MFITRVALLLVVAVFVDSAPQYNQAFVGRPGAFVPILSQHYDLNPDGSYTFGYKSGDGSSRDENGVVRNLGSAAEAMFVQGSYSYNSPAGPVSVSYIADENGFQPSGPGVHPEIVAAVAQQVANARSQPQGAYQGNTGFGGFRRF